jgi:hypothetical protein
MTTTTLKIAVVIPVVGLVEYAKVFPTLISTVKVIPTIIKTWIAAVDMIPTLVTSWAEVDISQEGEEDTLTPMVMVIVTDMVNKIKDSIKMVDSRDLCSLLSHMVIDTMVLIEVEVEEVIMEQVDITTATIMVPHSLLDFRAIEVHLQDHLDINVLPRHHLQDHMDIASIMLPLRHLQDLMDIVDIIGLMDHPLLLDIIGLLLHLDVVTSR